MSENNIPKQTRGVTLHMPKDVRRVVKKSHSLDEAIASKDRCVGGIMDGREVVRLAQRFDMSAEAVRAVLKKLGFKLEPTFSGRHIWRKRD